MVHWDHQKTVLDHVWGKNCLGVKTENENLIFTEPYFNFASIQVCNLAPSRP